MQSPWRQCLFISSLVFLLFFRGAWAFRVGWQNDEGCYLGILGNWLSLDLAGVCTRENYFAPGAPLLWLPVAWVAKQLALLWAIDPWFLVVPSVSLFSFALWGASLYLISLMVGESLFALALIGNIPVLYYATHWTLMPHTAELFVALLLVYCLIKNFWWGAVAAALLLTSIRFNDAPALLLPVAALFQARERRLSHGIGLVLVTVGLLAVGAKAFYTGYDSLKLQSLVPEITVANLGAFLFSSARGLAWLSPFLLVALSYALLKVKDLSWPARAGMLWIGTELLITAAWKGTGGDFGYRYCIGSYAALVLILYELRFPFRRLAFFGAAWLFYLTAVYRTIPALSPIAVASASNGLALIPPHDFFVQAIRAIFNVELYRGMLAQNFPAWTVWKSLNQNTTQRIFLVEGLPLLILCLATTTTSSVILCWFGRTIYNHKSIQKPTA